MKILTRAINKSNIDQDLWQAVVFLCLQPKVDVNASDSYGSVGQILAAHCHHSSQGESIHPDSVQHTVDVI